MAKPTNPEPEVASDPQRTSLSLQGSETLKLEAETDEYLNAAPESYSKTLSKSSKDEEGEEDEGTDTEVKEVEATSILPSSVLNKAIAIAQHLTNSSKLGGLVMDKTNSPDCLLPGVLSRTGSRLNLSAEPSDRSLQLKRSCSDPAETFGLTDLTLLSTGDNSLFDDDRGIRWRRDSTLSKQDQMLIGKIKSYYENAENQDAAFSIRRRESLTYIPNGLVRNSVSRIDNIPKEEAFAVEKNPLESTQTHSSAPTMTSMLGPSAVEPDSCSGGHMVSSASLDSDSAETDDSGFRSRSQSMQDKLAEEEEFRSSEMFKIWQAMEQQITISQRDVRVQQRCHEILRNSKTTNAGLSNLNKTTNKSSDKESAESDLSTIVEESTSPLPLKAIGLNQTSLKDALKVFREEGIVLRAPVPRVAQLKADAEPHSGNLNQLDDTDKAQTKVLHLARQYSQRIKTSKPVAQQQDTDVLINRMALPCMVEVKEKEGSGTNMSFFFSIRYGGNSSGACRKC